MYYLDSGMLAYYENDFSGAIERLSKAEQFIDDYYTKSVTQNMAAFLTNDTAIEYPGEDYEDIYINLIKTISYYKAGKWEEGFHELNAYRRKTNLLKQKYQNDINRVKEYAKISDNANVNVNFYDMKTNLQKLVPMNRSDMLYVPLDIPGSNLNNFNGIIPNTNLDPLNNNTITPSPVTFNNFVYPQQNYPYLYNPQYRQFFYNQNYYMNMIKMQQMTQMK